MPSPLQTLFLQLHQELISSKLLWQPSLFVNPSPSWLKLYPALTEQCLSLSENQLTELEQQPELLPQWLSAHLPHITQLTALTELEMNANSAAALAKQWDAGIPGRKAKQIKAFAEAFKPEGDILVDWCSGKAHLGRTLSALYAAPCLALEYNPTLCQQGNVLARKRNLNTHFVATDVLKLGVALPASSHICALHACGDLHRSLVAQATSHPVAALTFAPCCYPLWLDDTYTPLSKTALKHNLQLDRTDLHLAVQECVTATPREQSLSHKQATWRLGFDCLQRDIRQSDSYLNTPSLPLSALNNGFEHYCRTLAALKNLTLPQNIQWQHYEKAGEVRWAKLRRLQLVRHAYRRALELWLVLDLALRLEEANYTVVINQFCDRALTPRNIIINAKLNTY